MAGQMTRGYQALTDKEKTTLRLLLSGYDAKTMARHLGLSVHTVNERLRDSRRKMSVSSSREAARLLRDAEGDPPYSSADKHFGDAAAGSLGQESIPSIAGSPGQHRAVWIFGGLVMISLAVALFALSSTSRLAEVSEVSSESASTASAAAESAAVQSARQWLALVDASKWQESFLATTRSFQSLNTVATWQSASQSARVPLGAVLSRRLISEQSVPAPPNGVQVVRFKSSFANRREAIETLSLAREGENWKVAGYYID